MQEDIAADFQCMSYVERPSIKTRSLSLNVVVVTMEKKKAKAWYNRTGEKKVFSLD